MRPLISPADSTLPAPGSATAKTVFSRSMSRIIGALLRLPTDRLLDPVARREAQEFLGIVTALRTENPGALAVSIKASSPAKLSVTANGSLLGESEVGAGSLKTIRVPLGNRTWIGTIKTLRMDFKAAKGTTIELDWIRVE